MSNAIYHKRIRPRITTLDVSKMSNSTLKASEQVIPTPCNHKPAFVFNIQEDSRLATII
jgi:hypothetical protein